MSRFSSNALTARYCALAGAKCETVQRFYGGRRHDLFGMVDSVVLDENGIHFLQNCSYGTLKAHRDAIDVNDALPLLVSAGVHVVLFEWRKTKVGRKDHWKVRTQWKLRDGWSAVAPWSEPMDLYPVKKRG